MAIVLIAIVLTVLIAAGWAVYSSTNKLNEHSQTYYGFPAIRGWTITPIVLAQLLFVVALLMDNRSSHGSGSIFDGEQVTAALAVLVAVTLIVTVIIALKTSAPVATAALPLLLIISVVFAVIVLLALAGSDGDRRRRY
jgi:hypothetical protein